MTANTITKTVMGFHIDVFGHVNNARYLEFYEEARWLLYAEPINIALKQGFAFVIVNVNVNFRAALTLFDDINISAELARVNSRSAVIRQAITSVSGDKRYSDAEVTFVLLDVNTQTPAVIADNPICTQCIEEMQNFSNKGA